MRLRDRKKSAKENVSSSDIVTKQIDAIHQSDIRKLAKKIRKLVRETIPEADESLKWGRSLLHGCKRADSIDF